MVHFQVRWRGEDHEKTVGVLPGRRWMKVLSTLQIKETLGPVTEFLDRGKVFLDAVTPRPEPVEYDMMDFHSVRLDGAQAVQPKRVVLATGRKLGMSVEEIKFNSVGRPLSEYLTG